MSLKKLLPIIIAVVVAVPAFAGIPDDAIALAGSGVSDDVMIAWAQKQHDFTLSAREIIRLKDGKVPDAVIVQLIRAASQTAVVASNDAKTYRREEPVVERQPTRYIERSYAAPRTTYVVPSSTYYISDYGYPYYSSYGYPYYSSYGYPYYSSIGFGAGFAYGSHGCYNHGYCGQGYGYCGHGYGYSGGYYGHGYGNSGGYYGHGYSSGFHGHVGAGFRSR